MSNDRRNSYWDAVKGILIFLVVLGHYFQISISRLGGGYHLIEALLCSIYVFHMPLFVFVSGFFSKNVERCRFKALKGILVPLLVLQAVWLVWIALTDGVRSALSVALYPQFALWYLAALYLWRTLLPDLLRVRHVLVAALVLFFVGKMVGGLDNLFGLDRMVGFLVFFLLGYETEGERIVRVIRRIPVGLACFALILCAGLLWLCFSSGIVRFETVFYTLTHSRSIWDFSHLWKWAAAYLAAFIGAVFLSACVLRLSLMAKWRALSEVGRDTMPTYAVHGFIVHAVCFLLSLAGFDALPHVITAVLLLMLAVVTTAVLSTDSIRRGYAHTMDAVLRFVLRETED